MNKRLYRSDDPVIAGICGGLAEYLELDPTLVRILYVIVCFVGMGFPIILYLIIMFIMPKKPMDYYIDVRPSVSGSLPPVSSRSVDPATRTDTAAEGHTASAESAATVLSTAETAVDFRGSTVAGFTTSGAATLPGSGVGSTSSTCPIHGFSACSSPGSAYTTANPEAFDVKTTPIPEVENKGIGGGVQAGLVCGVTLIGLGLFGLANMFLGISLWHFWPMILAAVGLVILFTPNRKGWSLSRAGNAIFLITLAVVLQFWVFGFLTIGTFIHVIFMMWPVLLVLIGLGILTAVTGKNIFSLLGSLLVSAALIVGVWFFGNVPGFSMDLDIPLFEERTLHFNTPASPGRTVDE